MDGRSLEKCWQDDPTADRQYRRSTPGRETAVTVGFAADRIGSSPRVSLLPPKSAGTMLPADPAPGRPE
jgi:hypothetical protein